MRDICIATVIFHSPAGQIDNNLDRTAYFAKKAAEDGAAIVCFPEMHISGYSPGRHNNEWADTIPGKISTGLSDLSKDTGIIILAGIAERDSSDRIFASHLVTRPDGYVGTYRKVFLAPPEQAVFSMSENPQIFEALGIKFGIQLCYDAHFPELSTFMALSGADVIFFPHASPRGAPEEKFKSWMRHLPARAYDNGVFAVACNQVGDNGYGLEFPGVSLVLGPDGQIVQKTLSSDETLAITELKAADLAEVRHHRMRYFLPNRRPLLYGLLKNL
jgi:N-carbamoylputrescine amidase